MPITFEVDHEAKRVYAMGSEAITVEDMVGLVLALAEQRCFAYPQCFDARGAAIVMTAEDTRRMVPLVARLRAEHGHARTAFIADSDVSFGMARMYASLAVEVDSGFMAFRTLEEGAVWLGWPTLHDTRHDPA